ncbi:MAG TPA: hypothetical protein VLE70_16580 [Anaerolineae bacterium]|nr:hypothetical protein [Anaerolineae bacterium]
MSDRLRETAEAAGLPIVVPERISSSRRALEATEFARMHGRHDQFRTIFFCKF